MTTLLKIIQNGQSTIVELDPALDSYDESGSVLLTSRSRR